MRDLQKNRPSFFFRSDFALESGFVDQIRRELSPEQYARVRQRAGNGTSTLKSIEEFNRERSETPPPRYILTGGLIRPGTTTPAPALFDGKALIYIDPQCGLFADLLRRVAVVAPPRTGEISRILPKPLAAPQQRWSRAEFAVVHDAMTSTAEVWYWPEAWEALQAWAKSH